MRVGIIGLGFIGDLHLSSLQDVPDVEIGAVADRKKENRQAKKHLGCPIFDEGEKLIREGDLDLVDICVPTYLHKKFVEMAAKKGKDIICEKPISRYLSEAKQMRKIAHDNGIDLYIGHVVRFFPEYEKIRERVKGGEVGDPGIIRTFRGGSHPYRTAEWYADLEKSGGLLVDLLIHDFDWLRWVIGEVKSVFAKGFRRTENKKELAMVNLRFGNGSVAHVEGSWAHPTDYPFRTRVEVSGTEGLIEYDSAESAPLNVYSEESEKGSEAPKSPLSVNPWQRELEHFIECEKEDEEPKVSVQDAIEALKISLASLRSLEENRRMEVSDVDE